MDTDAYAAVHSASWRRLEELSEPRRRLSGAEADELVDLYERTATHLSVLRSSGADTDVLAYLSWLLGRARRVSTGATPGLRAAPARVGRFLTQTFPAALYRTLPWWGPTMALSFLASFAMGAWFVAHPEFETAVADPETVRRLVEVDFEHYYSEFAASSFAFRVWTNNAWIAAVCIGLGVFGVPVVYLLWMNLFNVALTASILIRHGRAALFFGLILPHGLLELTSVFVAAGVGLRLFWSWVEPGPRSRLESLAQEGRTSVGIAAGLALVLAACGIIEAFVTPSGLPTWARIGIGCVAEALFFAYVLVLGRRAARRGVTGDVDAAHREAVAPTVA